jgi:hypothetical protein
VPAPFAPVLHLRHLSSWKLFQTYACSFDRVWDYQHADEQAWLRSRVLSFLGSTYFEDVMNAAPCMFGAGSSEIERPARIRAAKYLPHVPKFMYFINVIGRRRNGQLAVRQEVLRNGS